MGIKKQFWTLLFFATLSGCSIINSEESSENKRGPATTQEANAEGVGPSDPKVVDPAGEEKLQQVTEKTAEIPQIDGLSLVNLKPVLRFASADALETIFRRVFPKDSLRRSDLDTYFRSNPNHYFSLVERANLGSFNINAPVGTEVNVDELKSLTLSYTRAYRGFLADACNKLVDSELAVTDRSKNLLITTDGVPSVASLNGFAVRLFGYPHPKGAFPQVATYQKIIAESLASMTKAGFLPASTEYKSAYKSNFVLYCMAMSSDPELFTY